MDIFSQLLYFLIVIPSAIFHEYMHGWVADQLGDPTARNAGRLTLDPRAHIDLRGTILMPLALLIMSGGRMMFASAKPVPYNPYNLRYQRVGPFIVALAGPLSNFFLAAVFAVLVRVLPGSVLTELLLGVVYVNIALAVFNLIPLPPLDGSKILYLFLPSDSWRIQETMERYGIVLVIAFVLFFPAFIVPAVETLFRLFVFGW
jgi:Zn-dependent protease